MYKSILAAAMTMAVANTAWAQDPGYPPDPGVYQNRDSTRVAWADVLRVDPIYTTVRTHRPHQECYDAPVVRREGNNTAGTVLGAIVGGALGNQVGKGDGRKAATIAGAVAGGAVGHGVSSRNDRVYEDSETRCRPVDSVADERRVDGYDVEYRYRGDVYVSRLDYDPGERLRVRVSVTPAE